MLDRFVYGNVERISPESPVPVLHKTKSLCVPGGAGNVARNIASLGGMPLLIGLLGKDEAGETIKNELKNDSITETYFFQKKEFLTTEKTRFISQGQQLLRVDQEKIEAINEIVEEEIINYIKTVNCDAIILSDYGKGIFLKTLAQKVIHYFQDKKPIIIDPKGKDYSRYKGAFLITPNLKELEDVYGKKISTQEELFHAGRKIQEEFDFKRCVITQGPQGMTFLGEKEDCFWIPSKAKEVYDVSGAGDTVIAALSLCIANKIDFYNSCQIANLAAGIVVGKLGTATVKKKELESFIQGSFSQAYESINDLKEQIEEWKRKGLKVGFTNGCFDLIHLGHLHLLEEASLLCDKLIVAINSDQSIKRLKGPERPIQTEKSRSKILSSLSLIDAVIVFEEDTPLNLIESLNPDIIFKGGDYTKEKIVGSDIIIEKGGEVVIINLKEGYGTTKLVNQMKNNALNDKNV